MLSEHEQMKKDEMVRGLRELADLLEEQAGVGFPLPYNVLIDVSVTSSEYKNTAGPGEEPKYETVYDNEATIAALRKATKAIRGKKEKEFTDYRMAVTKKFSTNVSFTVYSSRQAVCKKVPTGKKITYAAQVIPERVEEEYTWVCEDTSLLAS